MVIYCLFAFPPFKLAVFWPLIDANIRDQLPKSQKKACKAYRSVFSQKRSVGMPYRTTSSPVLIECW